jgi:16S rRNA (uracil1498-N3)-methyltransferase
MRLTRVYLGATLTPGSVVELPPETASHVAKVLRGRAGDELIVFNGDGREFFGSIESVRGTRVTASVGGATTVDRESALSITLVQCVPRGDRMDFIIQKATELGVTRIVPVLSQRSVVRLDSAQAAAKAVHWRAVAINACEQCGRNRLPLVEPESRPADLPHLTSAAEIAIGPEGGFTPEELDALHIANFVKIRLGPRILRTETAAIAAMTWLQTRYGDMRLGA